MAVLFDYFSASSDQAAATAVSLRGGPGVPRGDQRRRGWPDGRRASTPAGAPFDTIAAQGIDLVVQLGTLEALLTGREYEQVVAGPRAGHALATQGGGERLVVTVTDELQAALANADDAPARFCRRVVVADRGVLRPGRSPDPGRVAPRAG